MARSKPNLSQSPHNGVTVDFFCGVTKLLTRKYGDRLLDVEWLRQRLEQIENAYIRSEVWKPEKHNMDTARRG